MVYDGYVFDNTSRNVELEVIQEAFNLQLKCVVPVSHRFSNCISFVVLTIYSAAQIITVRAEIIRII